MVRTASFVVFALLLGACGLITPTPASKTAPAPATGTSGAPSLTAPPSAAPSDKVAAFYYPWYGSPQFDGKWRHWTQNGHTPPEDIASDFYPALGAYSSNDPGVVDQHMRWLRDAKVGVIIVSWWGQGSPDERPVPLILATAARYGIKVAFHIEPYSTRTAETLVNDIKYLYAQYGSSPAFFRSRLTSTYSSGTEAKGMFFLWCVEHTGDCGQGPKVKANYWQAAIDAIHALPDRALVIANTTDGSWVTDGHFDGIYNYTALRVIRTKGFSWAKSIPAGGLYIPSVIPGFSAQRVGYPNDTTVPRNDGQTYNEQWTAALSTGVQPAMVTITSFNEWHEGSMIEPAATGKADAMGNNYQDFGTLPADGYLTLTREWVDKLLASPRAGTYPQLVSSGQWSVFSVP